MPHNLIARSKQWLYRRLPRERKPNFFILGAGKSGTTSMYYYLNQHPEIFFPTVKEPAYFAFSNFAGNHYHSEDQSWVNQCVTDPVEYQALFKNVANEQIIGDATPIYLYHPNSAEAIYRACPNAKLLVILRDPYDRAYSDYLMHVRDNNEKRTFLDALKQDHGKYRFYVGSYLEKSLYGEQLQRYYNYFDREQLMIIPFADLSKNSEKTVKSVIEFLEIDASFIPNCSDSYNQGASKSKQAPADAVNLSLIHI